MAIVAAQSPMSNAINAAWSMGKGAQIATSSQMVCMAIASVVPMGLYPTPPSMTPLTPAGYSAAVSLMTSAMSMGKGAQISTTSKQMAQAIALIAPLCPSIGLSSLGSMIEAAMSMGKGAQINTTAQQLAQAIVTYYTTGGTT